MRAPGWWRCGNRCLIWSKRESLKVDTWSHQQPKPTTSPSTFHSSSPSSSSSLSTLDCKASYLSSPGLVFITRSAISYLYLFLCLCLYFCLYLYLYMSTSGSITLDCKALYLSSPGLVFITKSAILSTAKKFSDWWRTFLCLYYFIAQLEIHIYLTTKDQVGLKFPGYSK